MEPESSIQKLLEEFLSFILQYVSPEHKHSHRQKGRAAQLGLPKDARPKHPMVLSNLEDDTFMVCRP